MARGFKHYWRKSIQHARPQQFEARLETHAPSGCDPSKTLAMLSCHPQSALGWFARHFAFLTTPFKRLGISGWTETGCDAKGVGTPVRDAQHSADGFWTIDVQLQTISVGQAEGPVNRFIRIEVEPNTAAHQECEKKQVLSGMLIDFGGPVVIDNDGPFLEVHPDQDFSIGPPLGSQGK